METGWYSPDLNRSSGTVSIEYWNGVVNMYSPRGKVDPNDASLYTAEHYIASLKVYLDACSRAGKRAIVDLPIAQVWDEADWAPNRWAAQIVEAVHRHEAVAAFYLADEPEVWGYSEVNTAPVLPLEFLQSRYRAVKSVTDKPALVVFGDVALMEQKYGKAMNATDRFFDWFGFDNYPFLNRWEFNWSRVERQLEGMSRLWRRAGSLPLVYVGQGCGDKNIRGEANFGQRNPSSEELDQMLAKVMGYFAKPDVYLLWSWAYADDYMRTLGNVHLESVADVAPQTPAAWWRKLLNRLFGL